MRRVITTVGIFTVGLSMLIMSAPAYAQGKRSVDPRRETAQRMLKPITVSFQDARLEDVMRFIADFTGATLDVMWIDDQHVDGLDKDARVTLSANNIPTLSMLERLLKRSSQGFDGATWQFAKTGELQIGPKSRLNADAYLKLYDIRDLLFAVQDFTDVPNLGLGRIIQGQGSGSTNTNFQFEKSDTRGTDEEEAMKIVDIIVRFIEPEQWSDNGGDGGSITYYNGHLLVRAPDYIQRQLVGYSFWPTEVARGRSSLLGDLRGTAEPQEKPADKQPQPAAAKAGDKD